jgi:hypothetical protein
MKASLPEPVWWELPRAVGRRHVQHDEIPGRNHLIGAGGMGQQGERLNADRLGPGVSHTVAVGHGHPTGDGGVHREPPGSCRDEAAAGPARGTERLFGRQFMVGQPPSEFEMEELHHSRSPAHAHDDAALAATLTRHPSVHGATSAV